MEMYLLFSLDKSDLTCLYLKYNRQNKRNSFLEISDDEQTVMISFSFNTYTALKWVWEHWKWHFTQRSLANMQRWPFKHIFGFHCLLLKRALNWLCHFSSHDWILRRDLLIKNTGMWKLCSRWSFSQAFWWDHLPKCIKFFYFTCISCKKNQKNKKLLKSPQ